MKPRTFLATTTLLLTAISVLGYLAGSTLIHAQPLPHQASSTVASTSAEQPLIVRFMIKQMTDYLDLSNEQQEQIEATVSDRLPVIKPLVREILDNRDRLDALNRSEIFDETAVKNLIEQQTDVVNDLMLEKERIRYQIYQTLTAEQQQKAADFRTGIEDMIKGLLSL